MTARMIRRRGETRDESPSIRRELTEIYHRLNELNLWKDAVQHALGFGLGMLAPLPATNDSDGDLTREEIMQAILESHKPGAPAPVGGFTGEFKSIGGVGEDQAWRVGMTGERWMAIQMGTDGNVRGMFIEDKYGNRTQINPDTLVDEEATP